MSNSHKALTAAVNLAGSQSALAEICGVQRATVSYWVAQRKPIPAEHVLKIEKALGISRHTLRSDIYPQEGN